MERKALYTLEDGRSPRVPAYRGEMPLLGQCVDAQTYGLAPGVCAPIEENDEDRRLRDVRVLEKQGFRSYSQMLSVEADVEAQISGQKAKVKTSVAKHRLFLEWDRYIVHSLSPLGAAKVGSVAVTKPYVSAVEYGIGVRIILDISLIGVDAGTNLTFTLGTVAASVALGRANVSVQYDTIGVARDILPADLPVAIESVGDISRMMAGFHGAVTQISDQWNDEVKRRKLGEAPGTVGAPPPSVGDSSPDGTGATTAGGSAEIPAAWVKGLIAEVEAAKKTVVSQKADLAALLADDAPIIGGRGFEALKQKVNRDQEISIAELGALLVSIEQHGQRLKAMEPSERTKKLGAHPEGLLQRERIEHILRVYYPLLHGGEDQLFPRGFTAAPIAYYVARSEANILRDECEAARLSQAARREKPDKTTHEKCKSVGRAAE